VEYHYEPAATAKGLLLASGDSIIFSF